MRKCIECKTRTANPKFCTISCGTIFNNKKRGRHINHCVDCGIEIANRSKRCKECRTLLTSNDWSTITLGEMIGRRKHQAHSAIRTLARAIYRKSDKPKICKICGYSKHYHVCHKKAIDTYSLDTPISTINRLGNLMAMCPTHHWEFDHKCLDAPVV